MVEHMIMQPSSWLQMLMHFAEERPLVVIRFDRDQWESLAGSRRGLNEFTIARSHALLEGVRPPAPCLVVGTDLDPRSAERDIPGDLHFALIRSRSAISTLDSRIKVKRSLRIFPRLESDLLKLVVDKPYARNLQDRLRSDASIVQLSPKLSSHLVERLASIDSNHGALRAVSESLVAPRIFRNAAALQEDAVRTALKAFGLTGDDPASSLELVKGRETGLVRVGILEDSVIEHDARRLPVSNLSRAISLVALFLVKATIA
jgi:hypothetical protein